jgi:hypothetical protein
MDGKKVSRGSSPRLPSDEGETSKGAVAERGRAELTVVRIVAWADAFHAATGRWPNAMDGLVRDAAFPMTWYGIHLALVVGRFGLPGRSSLSQLLIEHGRVGSEAALTWEQIVAWATAHRESTGSWPTPATGKVLGRANENWRAIDQALRWGDRGLPPGSSLVRLLREHCRASLRRRSPEPLTLDAILAWGDAYHATTGEWPVGPEGEVRGGPPGLTWQAIRTALRQGGRGLPGGTSLVRLWAEYRDRRPVLSLERILAWADAHREATGSWPTSVSGAVLGVQRESWRGIDRCLNQGARGLPGGHRLADLPAEHRGVRARRRGKPLTVEQVVAWADAHHAATGRWPSDAAGPVRGVPGESWAAICAALRRGWRGLTVRTTLANLLLAHRGPAASNRPPRLSVAEILSWADAHHAATGRWPTRTTGPVAPGITETWSRIDAALRYGCRGFPGGLSLRRLLSQHRSYRRGSTNALAVPA